MRTAPGGDANADPDSAGSVTRGLLGAVELRDPDDGVILPHENTMAGPVSDRLALMTATEANLEPIYLVYDGGGAASRLGGLGVRAGTGQPRPSRRMESAIGYGPFSIGTSYTGWLRTWPAGAG